MLRTQDVKGSPTEVQLFGEDDLAKQLSGHDSEMLCEIFNTSMTGAGNCGGESANSNISSNFEVIGVLQFDNLKHDGQIDLATLKVPLMHGAEVVMA